MQIKLRIVHSFINKKRSLLRCCYTDEILLSSTSAV